MPEGACPAGAESGRARAAGAAAAAFGEEDERELHGFRHRNAAVGLDVVPAALGAGKHHVVVGHNETAARRRIELVAVHGSDADDHAVAGTLLDELLTGEAAIRRQHERPVLDERTRVAEVGDVFARGPVAGLVALCHGRRAGGVGSAEMPVEDLGEVRPDEFEVDGILHSRPVVCGC